MSESDRQLADMTTIERTVLTAIRKGFTKISNIVAYCGPEIAEEDSRNTKRELDVPQIMRAIERLIQRGYLERSDNRMIKQLNVRLTEEGQRVAPLLTENEENLLERYRIPVEALQVLAHVVNFQEKHGSLPSISQVESKTGADLSTYRIQPYYARLVATGLAESHGLLRFKINPTKKGRMAIKEFNNLI